MQDSARAKRLSERALDRKLAALDPQPSFVTAPRWHQKICFLLGVKYPGYFFMPDMSLGKTKIMLDLLAWRIARGEVTRALALVPNIANIPNWLDEVEKHQPGIRAEGLLQGGPAARRQCVEGDSQLLIATYAGILRFATTARRNKKTKKDEWVVDDKLATQLARHFQFVIYDESTLLANQNSVTARVARRLSKQATFTYALSGAPMDKNPKALWSQFYLVDRGATLGQTLGLFEAAFFKPEKTYFSPWPEYVFDDSKRELLARTIRHRSIAFKTDDCVDLPPAVGGIESPDGPMVRSVIFTKEMWDYYEKIINAIKDSGGSFELLDNAFLRMRQLTAGYLSMKDSEGEKHEVVFKQNPKLDALEAWLEEIPSHCKIIIFHKYKPTGRIICERLKAKKYSHLWLYGDTQKPVEVLRQFKTNPKRRILVCSEAGAFGLNLQVANYTAFYESPERADVRSQMEKRTRRLGQERTTFYTDFVVKNSVDEKLLRSLVEGKNLRDDLIKTGASALV